MSDRIITRCPGMNGRGLVCQSNGKWCGWGCVKANVSQVSTLYISAFLFLLFSSVGDEMT